MIKHVVMWKLKEVAEGKTKAENAKVMKRLLEDLPGKIEQLDKAEVGIQLMTDAGPAASDIVLTTECADLDALKFYAEHPDHKKVVSFIQKVAEERRVVDYEC